MKTSRYAGRSDWETFLAQFELLTQAEGWSVGKKALQLALSLTDDALSSSVEPQLRHAMGKPLGARIVEDMRTQVSAPSVPL